MESSIAEFLLRWLACELLPTVRIGFHQVHAHFCAALWDGNMASELVFQQHLSKLTWLVLGGDPAARSHRVEQFTAL